jgi:hypothetical protein
LPERLFRRTGPPHRHPDDNGITAETNDARRAGMIVPQNLQVIRHRNRVGLLSWLFI